MPKSNNKCNCKVCDTIKSLSLETKIVFTALIILAISNITLFMVKAPKNIIEKNPKQIVDALNKYIEEEQTKQQEQQRKQSANAVKDNADAIKISKNRGVANPKGSKLIVEFFDYNCSYCQMASTAIVNIVKNNPDVKVIFRELPILSQASTVAAQYSTAVAMVAPEKYVSFHDALIHGGAREKSGITAALKKANINVDLIEKTVKNKASEIEAVISENLELAQKLGLSGTPAFVIGDQFIPGYIDEATIMDMLK